MKASKEEKKRIETILHPCPTVNGCEILHSHLPNGLIEFTAWIGDNRFGYKGIRYSKYQILECSGDFYQVQAKDIEDITKA